MPPKARPKITPSETTNSESPSKPSSSSTNRSSCGGNSRELDVNGLQTQISELSTLVKKQATIIESLTIKINDVESNMARKVNELTIERKASSDATINVVTGFFAQLDKKLSEHVKESAVKMDVIQHDIHQHKLTIDQHTEHLKQGPGPLTVPVSQSNQSSGQNVELFYDSSEKLADGQNSHDNGRFSEIEKKIKAVMKNVEKLKESYDFISGETTAINNRITENNVYKYRQDENMMKLTEKCDDLEDRGRRDNLLFFGIPEKENSMESWKECEDKVLDIVNDVILRPSGAVCSSNQIARAHRLGIYKNNKIRPIIVKFENHKIKQTILELCRDHNMGKKKEDINRVPISEDYCKNTQDIRKELIIKLKYAQDACEEITGGFLKYKQLILMYGEDENALRQTFTLDMIKKNPKWYLPKRKQ